MTAEESRLWADEWERQVSMGRTFGEAERQANRYILALQNLAQAAARPTVMTADGLVWR